jgi:predicted permease
MDRLAQDIRYALRALRKKPGFACVAVLMLALGIGANTAVFSAFHALWIRPLPIEDVDRLVFGMALREGFDPFGTSLLEYRLYREEARSFERSGVGAATSFHLAASEPERLRGAAVTASYLRTLGVVPVLGRTFRDDEDRPGGPAVALLGHELWQRRFGGDRGAAGASIVLDGRSHAVVGVLPPGFDLPFSAEVWVPMQVPPGLPWDQQAANGNELVARLAPGVSLAEADAELKRLARRLEAEHPTLRRGWSYGLVPLRQQLLADLDGRARRSSVLLLVAVGLLLLICCANVGSLLLARGVAREGEIALRRSLGATTGRLVRQLLTESLLLAALGGALGVLLAAWLQPLLAALNPMRAVGLGAHLGDYHLDAQVLGFAIAVTAATGIASGMAPCLRAPGPMVSLRRREPRVVGGGGRALAALVVVEVALATALLVGGGLTMKSLHRLSQVELGFRPDGVLAVELPLSPARLASRHERIRFAEEVLARVRALPGVAAAGMSTNLPLQRGIQLDAVFDVEGRPAPGPDRVPITAHRMVTPGYAETIGVTLVEGRHLEARDGRDAPPVVVVSEELVRQAWPGESPLGKRVRRLRAGPPGPWITVVGVVRDVKEDSFGFRRDRPVWYVPLAQQDAPPPDGLPLNLAVRVAGDPTAAAGAVRAAIREVDPDQPVASVAPLSDVFTAILVGDRFTAVLMGTLAGLGLALAALGLYGVLAYSVGSRSGEIGLRLALGARPRDVLRLVFGQGFALLGVGLAVGAGGAVAIGRLLASNLYEVSPGDPWIFALVAVALCASGLLACWLPARRATRIDPVAALRGD